MSFRCWCVYVVHVAPCFVLSMMLCFVLVCAWFVVVYVLFCLVCVCVCLCVVLFSVWCLLLC